MRVPTKMCKEEVVHGSVGLSGGAVIVEGFGKSSHYAGEGVVIVFKELNNETEYEVVDK